MTMRIEEAITLIDHLPDFWVRLEEVRRVSRGFDLSFSVHKGRRGRRIDAWRIRCLEVHEAKITAMDLGGMALYSSTHPAAREAVARQAEVRGGGSSDQALLMGVLYKAHTETVDDWIPFDWHSSIKAISGNKFAIRGPDFLMRAYAKALRSIGKQPQVILRGRNRKASRPKVLHFGESYIVADTFVAERYGEKEQDQPVTGIRAGDKTKSRRLAGGPSLDDSSKSR
jgi:hypothetical protein